MANFLSVITRYGIEVLINVNHIISVGKDLSEAGDGGSWIQTIDQASQDAPYLVKESLDLIKHAIIRAVPDFPSIIYVKDLGISMQQVGGTDHFVLDAGSASEIANAIMDAPLTMDRGKGK